VQRRQGTLGVEATQHDHDLRPARAPRFGARPGGLAVDEPGRHFDAGGAADHRPPGRLSASPEAVAARVREGAQGDEGTVGKRHGDLGVSNGGRAPAGWRQGPAQVAVEREDPGIRQGPLALCSGHGQACRQRRSSKKIIDALPLGLYVIDRDFRIQAWNRKRETGTVGVPRDEAIGRPIFEVLSGQPRDLLQREFAEVFRTGRMRVVERQGDGDGAARTYRIAAIPMRLDDDAVTHVVTIGEDVTEQREAQRRVAQSEKLAAIGQLAAGVVHEINNPLATIGACADAVRARAEDAGPEVAAGIEEYLTIVEAEVQRCQRIVAGLLDFGRPRPAAKAPVAVNAVVEQTLFLLKHHERFRRVAVLRELAEDLPDVHACAEQLVQVVMALLLNAGDAMGARGKLTVRTRRASQGADEVVIAVADTGHGIAPRDVGRIFEPFFTTKPPGQGSGLGLAICHTIVAEHGGRIEVNSQPGCGSTFTIVLPVHARPGR
jgi:two-component system NtrC family sensor kinase